ncbi:MAG: hypothetical protein IT292_08260 [Deltaproteobacteria bacterium]|nr:hypothetical protein [Deltaproteobacteria bacterium]
MRAVNLKSVALTTKFNTVVIVIVFILIFVQNCFISLSFDDYGYATLSYAVSAEHPIDLINEGHDHGISDILRYTYFNYLYWSGRVVCTFLVVIFLATPLPIFCFKLVQTVLVFYFLLFLSRSEKSGKHSYDFKILLLVTALYFLVPLKVINDSSMWITASFGYLWLSLTSIVLIFYFAKAQALSLIKSLLITLLYFVVGCSNELLGLGFCSALLCSLLGEYFLQRKINRQKAFWLLSASCGFLLLLTAPGNFARLDTVKRFAGSSLSQIIERRWPELIKSSIRIEYFPLIILAILILFLLAYQLRARQTLSVRLNKFLPTILFGLLVFYALIPTGILHYFGHWPALKYFVLFGGLLTIAVYLASVHFFKNKDPLLLALVVAILTYNLGRLLVPSDVHRIALPLYLILISSAAYIVKFYRVNLRPGYLTALCFIALVYWCYVTTGYVINYTIHQANSRLLQRAAEKIKNGESVKEIILQKFDLSFNSSSPWKKHQYELIWMKRYYLIPDDITVRYEGEDVSVFKRLFGH